MVHERDDEYEGQEDGEYHFSDDQANYEMEPEVTKTAAPAPAKPAVPGGTAKSLKRPIIGVLVFIFVIFLVYKIISPSTNIPATEFSQNTVAPTKSITTHQPVEKTTVVTTTKLPVQQPVQSEITAPTVTTTTVSSAPTVTPEAPAQQQTITQTTSAPYQLPAQPISPTGGAEMSSAQASTAIDKLISLQDQNTKLVTQLQAESAQKIAEYEAQNSEMQGKIQDMTLRITSLENTVNHLTKLLQETRGGGVGGGNMGASGRVAEMSEGSPVIMARPVSQSQGKSAYSVQAIIPGRAWLKSENGETVTVAEGDIIKNYGKIIKIDPYDGVVQIDTAGKLVTLSYGASTE